MLEVGNGGMTAPEYTAHFSLWSLLNAPLLLGNDLRSMSAATLPIIRNSEVLAVDQDWGGSQGRRVRDFGEPEVWAKPMSDSSVAAVLFNRTAATATITTSAAETVSAGPAPTPSAICGRPRIPLPRVRSAPPSRPTAQRCCG